MRVDALAGAVDALAGADAVEKPMESPEVLLGGDDAGHGGGRRYDPRELVSWSGGESLVPGGYPFLHGGRAGLVQIGNIQGDRAEHITEQQVRRACGVSRSEASVGEELKEPFT